MGAEYYTNSQVLLDLVWENNIFGLALTDMEGNIQKFNRTFLDIFDAGVHFGHKNIYKYFPNSDLGENDKKFPEIIQDNENPLPILFNLSTPRGNEKFLEIHYNFQIEKGKRISILFIIQDITIQKHTEWEIQKVKEQTEESERLKASFLAKMSHEIRTPMNGIIGFSSMLLDPDLNDEKRHQFVDIITESSNQLLDLIDDLIDLSKIEAHQVEISNKEFFLNDLTNDIFAYFAPTAESKGIEFIVSPGLPLPESKIISDEIKVKQVLNNLVSNALKFTHEGRIEFGYQIDQKEIQFFVKDTGIGIESKYYKTIFERFRQADDTDTRQYGGTGIGLPISKSYIELMGGRIWLQSKLNFGSTFYFTLPYHPVIKGDMSAKSSPGSNLPNWNKKTVLIAEDEEINFLYITEVLSGTNVNILIARNGLEAVEIVKTNSNIDLILMDIKMPEMNGYEATKIIKQHKPGLPIIAQTAYAMAGDREIALSVGCDDYISKPVKKDKLISILLNYMH
jgi:PAS domain S-box-containing protein